MIKTYKLIPFLLLTFVVSCAQLQPNINESYSGWTHLELGAGNYGLDGHTKISQQKTVRPELAMEISS